MSLNIPGSTVTWAMDIHPLLGFTSAVLWMGVAQVAAISFGMLLEYLGIFPEE